MSSDEISTSNNSSTTSPIISLLLQGRITEFYYDHYNVETNWYAFWIPFSFWCTGWMYAKITKREIGRWVAFHNVHHIGVIVLGSISLYYDDDTIYNERNTILFTLSYFLFELLDVVLHWNLAYVAHATFVLVLALANYHIPLLRSLRMASKATYIESSTIILPYVKRYRVAWLFKIWATIYTVCRMIWIPYMMKDLFIHGMDVTHPVMIGVGLFYCLNIYWYIKIIQIAIKGSGNEKKKDY